MQYGPQVGWFIVDPKEVMERRKKKKKVPGWMVQIAQEKLEAMKNGNVNEVLIHTHYGVH